MRIAFDAYGGDHAPDSVIKGILQSAKEWPNTTFVLIGQDENLCPKKIDNIEFYYASEKIEADDEPIKAVRQKKDSSIVVGCQLVRQKKVDAFISAGNTGALMTAGLLYTGRIKGVSRPALAPIFPTLSKKGILVLDVGANPDAKPEHLRQYASMGSIYFRKVLNISEPRVGLLNIGTEVGKGSQLTKETFERLEEDHSIRFIGNIEARDVLYGPCEVIVTDGFSGNILLKNSEGVAQAMLEQMREIFMANWLTKLSAFILKPYLKQFMKEMDYHQYGGAPLLGLAGAVIKAHGSSDATAIFHAVRQARLLVKHGVISKIEEELSKKKELTKEKRLKV